jgi:hypothetical protein
MDTERNGNKPMSDGRSSVEARFAGPAAIVTGVPDDPDRMPQIGRH